jgi:hypothetical protein
MAHKDKHLLEVRCANQLELTLKALSRYKRHLKGVAIESILTALVSIACS